MAYKSVDSEDFSVLNRTVAGQALAHQLSHYQTTPNLLVLALPRGGVAVAIEIASALQAPLDVLIVRKLGAPGFPELAMGAIAHGGIRVLNHDVIHAYGISAKQIDMIIQSEERELNRREQAYRAKRPWPKLTDKIVIIVDDGLATGATMQAAMEAVRSQKPQKIIIAVTVAPYEILRSLRQTVDEVVCLHASHSFSSVGQWYEDFSSVSDAQVIDGLTAYWQTQNVQLIARAQDIFYAPH